MIYFLIILSLLLLSAGIAGLSAAPWVPTRKKDVERFLRIAEIKKGDVVYDLGCGDGRLLLAVKKVGAKEMGIELSFLNWFYCCLRGIDVKFGNFFKQDFSTADVVYMFLSQKAHNKMGEILKKQLKSGARIICYVWPIEGLEARNVDKENDFPNLYLYRM